MIVMLKRFLLLVVLFTGFSVNAQLYELGVLAGGSNYVGDVGREFYIYPSNYFVGGIFKHNVNKRFALRLAGTYTELKANDKQAFSKVRRDRGYKFSNRIFEASAGIEFNYWKFDIDDHDYTHTPYLLFEFTTIFGVHEKDEKGRDKKKVAYAIPFGAGYKFRLFRDIILGFEIRGRYALTDNLDIDAPRNAGVENLKFGNPDTNDWYFFTGIQLTYWFGRPDCHSPAF